MPIFPPRNEPTKKRLQLNQKKQELKKALISELPIDQLHKVVEKYRSAQLSLLKAKIHEFKERQFRNKPRLNNLESLEKQVLFWTNQSVEEIIESF